MVTSKSSHLGEKWLKFHRLVFDMKYRHFLTGFDVRTIFIKFLEGVQKSKGSDVITPETAGRIVSKIAPSDSTRKISPDWLSLEALRPFWNFTQIRIFSLTLHEMTFYHSYFTYFAIIHLDESLWKCSKYSSLSHISGGRLIYGHYIEICMPKVMVSC